MKVKDLDIYLQPTPSIDCEHPLIVRMVEELIRGCSGDSEKAVRLFYYVRDKCHYNMYDLSDDPDEYRSSRILGKGQGWCMPKAILLTSLCRAARIPSRLILTSIRNHKSPPEAVEMMGTNIFFPHVYNHIYLNRSWVKAAPTFDYDICERIGVAAVEFDGINDAILPRQDLAGGLYIEYLEEYGVFADVPWKLISEIGYKIYGDNMRSWFK
ncbi:transglutaminase-like domain [hydrocarbon metagenome]|uniref:Transglutaminase-like domain n=1 Tax=hydrocarbon metagenome TaxID=938273 RepID=A0A0W8E352_9ZZZZ